MKVIPRRLFAHDDETVDGDPFGILERFSDRAGGADGPAMISRDTLMRLLILVGIVVIVGGSAVASLDSRP